MYVPAESVPLSQEQPHRMQSTAEGMKKKAEIFERNDPEECLIARLAKNDRAVSVSHRKRDVAFGDITFNARSVPE